MNSLRTPLKRLLDRSYDERDLQQVWRKIQARKNPSLGRVLLGYRLWLVPAVTLAIALFLLLGIPSRRETVGPLTYASGASLGTSLVQSRSAEDVVLVDGSQILVQADTRIDVLENRGDTFHTALRSGKGTFEVRSGGPRRWLVDVGGVTVEVVGTRFSLERDKSSVRVSVERGTVLVKGESVPDKIVRLDAGQVMDFSTGGKGLGQAEESPQLPERPTACSASASNDAPALSAVATVSASPHHAPSASLGLKGASLDLLLREADAARLAGDRGRSAQLLRQVIASANGDSRGIVASFSLAQIEMKDHPEEAAELLHSTIDAGIRGGFEEDTWARLVQAYARAGDKKKARDAALEYQRRFPSGSRLSEVQRWVNETE
jgi:transmembrane sensor